MTQRLTAMQRAIIAAPGHVLVDAGAGSGKTTTVVRAICHRLGVALPPAPGEEPLSPVSHRLAMDEIAAITFTNAAAADLKRKLRQALRSGGATALAQEVDAARIGTIHGFCGDLLRENALRSGARPAQRLLTDGEARVLLADCARDALHAAVQQRDVEGLRALLDGRRLKDVTEWVVKAAAGAGGRLERWARQREVLRDDERALLRLAQDATLLRVSRLAAESTSDFDHLLDATRDLLRDASVRRAIQRRIRLLVVDEFQDVDPVQRAIIELLGGLAGDDADPTRLMLVGDPKQSIYRFRHADVTLWREVERRFAAGAGTVLPLTENFRSKAAILGFVDRAIGGLMDTPVDDAQGVQDFEVRYSSLIPRSHAPEGDHKVELHVIPAASDGKAVSALRARELDAAGTALRIEELVRGDYGYGDIAILLAGWGAVDLFEAALRARGIPYYVRRGTGFWEAREVVDCMLALRAIRDPADDVAMVGFLKSPFVGVRDDTLLALAHAKGAGTYRDALALVPHERALLDRAAGLLTGFAALRDRIPLADLVQRLLFESGFIAACALQTDGPQRCANLRKLVRLAGQASPHSLGDFLREAQEARDRDDEAEPEPLYRERSDVVTITSIHSAKGLEWPVVFWCDLVREVRTEKERFCAGRDTFSLAAIDDDAEREEGEPAATDRHGALQSLCAREALAEAYRLWYVAATRAQDLLVLGAFPLGKASRSNPTPARSIISRLEGIGDADELEYTSAAGAVFHAVVRRLGDVSPPRLEARVEEPVLAVIPLPHRVPAGAARLSATQLMTFAQDGAQWQRTYVDRQPAPDDGRLAELRTAVLTGQVVHTALERFIDDDTDIDALIDEAIEMWDEDAPGAESSAGAALRRALRERVQKAVDSPRWRGLVAEHGARRELAFTRLLSDGTVLNGAFDLAAPGLDGEAARILDVKTGKVTGPAGATRYALQAAVYLDAARAISGGTGGTFELLHVPSGGITPVADPGPAAVHDVIARLRGR